MKSVEQQMLESISSGEVVNVKYMGGSQPGTVRRLSPISISEDDVRARCLESNAVKTFKLSKMVSSDDASNYKEEWNSELGQVKTLAEGGELISRQLESFGWVVHVEDESIGVYRRFKNGKLRKTSDVYIQYHEYRYDMDFDTGERVCAGLSERPWYVTKHSSSASSFKSLGKALLKFIENAKVAAEHFELEAESLQVNQLA